MSTNSQLLEQVVEGISSKGFLIDLSVSHWAGQAKLSEADLGLEGLTDADLHRLGRRQLIPRDEIAKITKVESRARARLAHVSYVFPIGGARFVPAKVLGNLLADLSLMRTEFNAEVDAFCARYDTMREAAHTEWLANAKRIKDELKKDDEWLAAFEARLGSSYPPVDKVRESFGMEWSLFQFALPQGLHTQLISATDAVQAAQLAEEARRKLEDQISGFVGEAAMELRRRTAELCTHVANQVIKSGDKVSERTLEPLRELIGQFRSLDFTGDADFAAQLDTLQKEWLGGGKGAGIAKDLRESADYRVALSKALTAVADKAVEKSESVAAEALDRFLKFGSGGRAVAAE